MERATDPKRGRLLAIVMQDRGMHGIPAMPRYDSPGTRVPRNTIPDRASISEGLWRPTACSDTSSDSNSSRGNRRSSKIPKYHARVSMPRSPSPGNFSPREIRLSSLVSAPASDRAIGESVETYGTVGPRHKGRVTGSRLIAVYLYRASNRLMAAFGFYGTWELIYGTRVRNNRNWRARYSVSIRDMHRKLRSWTL